MPRITGLGAYTAKLDRLAGPAVVAEIGRTLFVVGSQIAADAQISISDGAVSGAGHVASLPNMPPNSDTGQLAREIEVTQPAPLLTEVAAYAPYASALEFGTSKMAERPFMRPAAAKNRETGLAAIAAAVDRATKV